LRDRLLHSSASRRRPRGGFTLIELLVVIGIIVVLIGILLPVVSKIRTAAQTADTRNWINQLAGAIDRYQQDFRAYPGPLGNNDVYYTKFTGGPTFASGIKTMPANGFDTSTAVDSTKITMAENLVLGLLGGFYVDPTTATQLDYDPSKVGGGAYSLSTVLPKRYTPYLDSKQLSWRTGAAGMTGHYQDDAGSADDTIIPEFVDRYSDPMPILYMRAKVGASLAFASGATLSNSYNPIVTNDIAETATPGIRAGAYDISQIISYTGAFTGSWPSLALDTAVPPTGQSIGIGKSRPSSPPYTAPPANGNIYHGLQMQAWTGTATPTMTSQFPFDAYPYLVGSSGQVREKDGYILISAGPDRIYGTSDDICNFGTVGD
jgi:prepilin-type N-terminal cleavage/methylation domain-containing protein